MGPSCHGPKALAGAWVAVNGAVPERGADRAAAGGTGAIARTATAGLDGHGGARRPAVSGEGSWRGGVRLRANGHRARDAIVACGGGDRKSTRLNSSH